MSEPKYKRILLKLSGEALMGNQSGGIDAGIIQRLAGEIDDETLIQRVQATFETLIQAWRDARER